MLTRNDGHVRMELNEQTRRLLESRCLAGLWLLLAADLVFALGDWKLAVDRNGTLPLLKAFQFALIAWGFAALARRPRLESLVRIALAIAGSNCLLSAAVGVARGTIAALPLIDVILVMATATLLPWGPKPQLALVSIAAASVLWASGRTPDGLHTVFDYSGLAMFVAFPVSVYLAYEFDRYRLAIERRNIELRAWRDVVENANDAILTLDRDHHITGANPAAHLMFGYAEGELDGRSIDLLLAPEDGRALRERWPEALARETQQTIVSLDAVRKDGSAVAIEMKARRLRGDAGGLQAILRDVTERRMVERVRNDFIAMLSHDMKTPLASILGFAEMLGDHVGGSVELARIVDRIEANARIAHSLAVNFVDVARIESGSLELQLENESLNEIVDHVVRHQEGMARAREVSLEATLDERVPRLPLDRRHIDRVVANLLSNAIKFSPSRGRVRIGTAWEDGRAVLVVRDQGPGIPRHQLPNLFQRYRRLDDGHGDGSGLGLYIVKQIVEAHGGSVAVSCPEEGGSVFRVSFAERPLAA